MSPAYLVLASLMVVVAAQNSVAANDREAKAHQVAVLVSSHAQLARDQSLKELAQIASEIGLDDAEVSKVQGTTAELITKIQTDMTKEIERIVLAQVSDDEMLAVQTFYENGGQGMPSISLVTNRNLSDITQKYRVLMLTWLASFGEVVQGRCSRGEVPAAARAKYCNR